MSVRRVVFPAENGVKEKSRDVRLVLYFAMFTLDETEDSVMHRRFQVRLVLALVGRSLRKMTSGRRQQQRNFCAGWWQSQDTAEACETQHRRRGRAQVRRCQRVRQAERTLCDSTSLGQKGDPEM